jgi:hypothetical protein
MACREPVSRYAGRCLRARRSRVRHSHEVGHRVRGGARYPRLVARRVLSASELHGSAPRDKDMPFRRDCGRTDTLTGPIKIWMSAHALAILQSLILLCAANGAPVLFARLLGARFAHPIDGGIVWRDSHPLLGRSKTWRGLAAAVLLAACAAVLMSRPGSWARSLPPPHWWAIASRPSSNGVSGSSRAA